MKDETLCLLFQRLSYIRRLWVCGVMICDMTCESADPIQIPAYQVSLKFDLRQVNKYHKHSCQNGLTIGQSKLIHYTFNVMNYEVTYLRLVYSHIMYKIHHTYLRISTTCFTTWGATNEIKIHDFDTILACACNGDVIKQKVINGIIVNVK